MRFLDLLSSARKVFRKDLARELSRWKEKYAKERFYVFNGKEVICDLSKYGGAGGSHVHYVVRALCYCNDATYVDASNYLAFLREDDFETKADAEAYLNFNVARASELHPETEFYRYYKNGNVEIFKDGVWVKVNHVPANKRCSGCGLPICDNEDICANCGEPTIL